MKAVLVIDMPDGVSLDEWFANIYVDRLKAPIEEMLKGVPFDESKKFNFVPLKPMPQKKDPSSYEVYNHEAVGWNDCIEEIEGEGNETIQANGS